MVCQNALGRFGRAGMPEVWGSEKALLQEDSEAVVLQGLHLHLLGND